MDVIPFVHEGLGNSSYLAGLGNGDAVLFDAGRTAARSDRDDLGRHGPGVNVAPAPFR